jgi:DNA-binding PadR family transcriptional regulator
VAEKRYRTPSPQQVAVLKGLLGRDCSHGYDLMKLSGLGPGTLYGLLKRLHEEGYLMKRSEVVDGRNRVQYRLNERGLAYAERALFEAEYEAAQRGATLEAP